MRSLTRPGRKHAKLRAILCLASVVGLTLNGMTLHPLKVAGQQPAAPPAGKQTAPAGAYILRSQTNEVLVDVRVWDRSGHPVSGLNKEDFRVYEDGELQTVTSFSFENVEKLAQASAENGPPPTINLAKLPPNVSPVKIIQDHRLIVLFFDMTSMQPDDLMRAIKSAQDFVRTRMTPADLVAISTYTSILTVAQSFTNDRDALSKVLRSIRLGESSSLAESGTTGEPGTTDASGEEIVAQDVSQAFTPDQTEFNIFNTDEKLAAIESLAHMLRDVPGRKSIIHFSSGIQKTGLDNQVQLRAAEDELNQSNVSLYGVDSRGLVALPPGGDASSSSPAGTAVYSGRAHYSQVSSLQSGRETVASLAADTGGRMFTDLNDFSSAFQQVQAENSSYYLIGYSPSNTKSDGRFRHIRVELDRPGTKVLARPGYFAPKNFRQLTREDKDVQLQQALDLDTPFVELPFVLDAAYFQRADKKYDVVLAAKIPGSSVSFLQKSSNHQTEFDIVSRATDPAGHTAAVMRDTLPVKVSGETYEQVLQGNILYEGGSILPPGKYTIKVVIRENQSGKMGTFELPLTLPDMNDTKLTLSSVVLSNELKDASALTESRGRRRRRGPEEEEQPQPLQVGGHAVLPSVTRVFRTNQNLYVYLESYKAKPASSKSAPAPKSKSAAPSVGLIFFRGGVKVAESGPYPAKQIGPPEGQASYFVELPLEKFRPGRYAMQVNVIDPSANSVAFARVPLAIVKPPARPAPTPATSGGK